MKLLIALTFSFLPALTFAQANPVFVNNEAVTFQHWEHQFSLGIPAQFDSQKDPTASVGVVLRNKLTGYPSFNVLVLPGPYKALAKSPAEQQRDLQEEYAQVGLRDITITHAFRTEVGGRNAFRAELQYQVGSDRLRSTVLKLSGVSRHYVLTYIDHAELYESRAHWLNQILASFTSWGDSEIELAKELQLEKEIHQGWLVALACALLALLVAPLIIHRMHNRRPAIRTH